MTSDDHAAATTGPALPYNLPDISDAEIAAVVDVLRSGWLAPGERTRAFEAAFAAYCGVGHAVAVDSATAGMHLALVALGIGPGDEVITTPTTFAATVNVIIHAGATPVLADIRADDYCIDPQAIERALTPRTKAILPVHHAGSACDMDAIAAIARAHGLRVVGDAAHGVGTEAGGRSVGSLGDAAVFSFYPTKNVTSGRGGMLTTDDAALAERARLLALHGMSDDAWDRYTARGSWRYQVLAAGYNYAMSDYQAALGAAQFARIGEFQRTRRALAGRYSRRLGDLADVVLPAERAGTTHAWHLYVVRLRPERLTIGRDACIEQLRARGIGTSVHFIPIHHHPYYREAYGWAPGDFPVADAAFETMLSLPLYTRMTGHDVDRVCEAVADVVLAHRR
ncbi:MAG: DegT/DnrJ/EryC1/StrS aminotransferase family protein [Dehalococcoidia bacterium]|nr:DegT/DnrJ/EryC1/StrS aminotransferase family protein [Dehalococcoidia bacterium]